MVEKEALNTFYEELQIKGAPIIEEIGNDSEFMLVTMVYRNTEKSKSVYLIGDVFGGKIFGEVGVKHYLDQFLDTDLFYASYKVKKDARSLYLYLLDYNREEEIKRDNIRLDPFNKKQYTCPIDDKYPN